MAVELTKSERKIFGQVRINVQYSFGTKYMFSFVYDENGIAIDYEGGYNLPLSAEFRNQYTIEQHKQLVKNW
jgi:hypothetical protein